MARIRSVHPSLWTDENFVECSPMARLLYIGVWTESDDRGAFIWSPVQLKMRVFPADSVDVGPLLDELEQAKLIQGYEVAGKKYGAIKNFRKFQRPKKPNSIHPIPELMLVYVGLGSELDTIKGGQVPNLDLFNGGVVPQKGEKPIQMEDGGDKMEDGGEEEKNHGKKEIELPIDWTPDFCSDGSQARDIEKLWDEKYRQGQVEMFRDHHVSVGNKMKSWQAAWGKWVRNWKEFKRGKYEATDSSPIEITDSMVRAMSRRADQRTSG